MDFPAKCLLMPDLPKVSIPFAVEKNRGGQIDAAEYAAFVGHVRCSDHETWTCQKTLTRVSLMRLSMPS